jgi:hypothetical protein
MKNLILALILIVFITSCGENDTNEENLLPCNPSTSTITTSDIEGIWLTSEIIMTYNDCSEEDCGSKKDIYVKYTKIDDCRIKSTDCNDGATCNEESETFETYILDNNKLHRDEIIETKKTSYENCYAKSNINEVITFDSSSTASLFATASVLVDYTCPEALKEYECSIKVKCDITKIGDN